MRKLILTLLTILLVDMYGLAQSTSTPQQKNISGTIVSKDTRDPLVGATVTVKSNGTIVHGTVTDANGKFTIPFSPGNIITISYLGMQSQQIGPKNYNTLFILMNPGGNASLNEVVVTGYQTQKKVDLTGSVAVINMNEIKDIPNNNLMQALQGRVPGLYITGGGNPNGGVGTIAVRGFNTLGFTSPLYVIDGVATTDPSVFESLDPSTIQTVQVLKDASAASIYGSRASNGVIIVTTKQGAKGEIRIQFNNSITVQSYVNQLKVLNTQGYGRALWQAAINDGVNPNSITNLFKYTYHTGNNGNPVLDKIAVTPFVGGDSTEPSANTDWQSVMFHPGIITSNNLTLTTGSNNSSLLINLNYLNNTGLIKYNNGYRRYGARVNASTSAFNGILKIGNNAQFFQSSETPIPSDLGGASLLYDAIFISPLIPVHTTTGDFGGPLGSGFSDRDNPALTSYINRWNRNNELNIFGNLFVEIDPIKNLVIRSSLGYAYDNVYSRQILQTYASGFINRPINSLTINQSNELDLTWSNTANYHLDAGHSKVDFLVGTEALTSTLNTQGDYKQDFAIQTNDYFYLSAGTGLTTNSGTSIGDRLLSFFGKINYSWSDKYLASFTLRDDGSSRFGANNRFGLFPAASVGWRINNEPFLKQVRFLSDLKLRSGIGVTGNQQIGDAASLGLFQTNYGTVGQPGPGNIHNADVWANNGTAYPIAGQLSGNLPSGYVSVQAANPNLKWESTFELNEGIDFGFFNNSLTGSFDYFSRKTSNILIQPPYPGVEGEGQIQWVNGATMSNKGWELVLGYQNQIGQLSYSVNGNLFSFHDKITNLPKSVISAYPGDVQQTILGHSPFSLFGYVVQGIFQSQDEVKNHATQTGAAPGRLMYKDLNGDGVINALDQTWLGVQMPNLNYGLTVSLGYKAFSFSFFLQGIEGIKVDNGNKGSTDFIGLNPGVNVGQRALDAWTAQNTKSTIPALSLVDNNNESRFSGYFVENGSYMKLRNMEIGYTVPYKIKYITQIKIYLMGENLLTFKQNKGINAFTGADPENPGTNYPIPRNLTAGLNLSF